MNGRPLISIITPCLNRVQFVRPAIESVLAQHYEPIEHIVMDGGSTDGTLETLKAYAHLRVISGRDRGIYDALNKGIAMARGEIIAQLNTDDRFEPGIFPAIAELFAQNPDADAICGGARVFERRPTGEQTIMEYDSVPGNDLPYRATLGVPIFNAWFFRKKIFERVGPYSLEFPLIADRDFLIRCYLSKIKVIPYHAVVYHYLQHSESLTINPHNNLQPPFLDELMRFSEKYIRSKSADIPVKKYCTEWHDLTAIELLIARVRQRQVYDALKAIWTASRYHPVWPFIVIAQSPMRIRNYIRKKYAAQH
jgi:glycosyltransferase involved in cell wall biosynthesis